MAIPNNRVVVRVEALLARFLLWLLGWGAVLWGILVLPLFWQQATLHRAASELLKGHTFKIEWLLDEVQQAEATEGSSFCSPNTLHNVVILRLAILEEAMTARDKSAADSGYMPLYNATRESLSCSPADPFAWLTLFWLDTSKHGLDLDNEAYLRLSYALGPNEGWIALRRNRLAIAMFPRLPADLADDAVDEFVKLVDTGSLYTETAEIFASAGPSAQGHLLEGLKSAKGAPRQILARILYDKGFDVDVGGPDRPWQ